MKEQITDKPDSTDFNAKLLLYEQVGLIYRQSVYAIIASYAVVIVLILLLINQVDPSKIKTWFIIMSILVIYRIMIVILFNKIRPGIGSAEKWSRFIYLNSFLGGLLWGASGIYLFPHDSFPHQIFVLLILGGLCAAIVASYASLKWNVTIFSVLTLLPISIMFFFGSSEVSIYTGFLTLIFLALIIISSFEVHKTIKESLNLRIDKMDLIARLEDEKIRIENLNLDLRKEIKEREKTEQQKAALIDELQQALNEIKHLSGLLPICSECKKIRDDQGFWRQVEDYIASHSQAVFSHGICPECREKLYPLNKRSHPENKSKNNQNK